MTGSERGTGRWVSLAVASRLLGMNKSTLRQWADRGVVRAFRTPGGHRRFARQDLLRLLGEPALQTPNGALPPLGAGALQRVRRRLRSARADAPLWQARLDEEGLERLRSFGRRLMEMATQYSSEPRSRRRLLTQAAALGEEQGREMARRGVPLEEATQFYLFCRNSYLDTLAQAWDQREIPGGEFPRLWKQAMAFLDAVLVAVVAGYKQAAQAPAAERGS